jgi:hypothetical protein
VCLIEVQKWIFRPLLSGLTNPLGFVTITAIRRGAWRSVTYFFLRNTATNNSAAEQEWIDLEARFPHEMDRVHMHIQRVDACRSLTSAPLRQAQSVLGPPDLYWWEVAGVGAFYLYDGQDLAIVLVGRVGNPPSWGDMCDEARNRV